MKTAVKTAAKILELLGANPLTAETHLRARAERGDPEAFRAILDKVPHRAPTAGDE